MRLLFSFYVPPSLFSLIKLYHVHNKNNDLSRNGRTTNNKTNNSVVIGQNAANAITIVIDTIGINVLLDSMAPLHFVSAPNPRPHDTKILTDDDWKVSYVYDVLQ